MSELPQATIIKIANTSHDLHQTILEASSRPRGVGGLDVSHALSRLQSIKSASKRIIESLNHCAITGFPLDELLQGWIAANGHVVCQFALDEAKKAIKVDRPPRTFFGLAISRTNFIPDHQIHEAAEVLRKNQEYLDCLLALGASNRISMRAVYESYGSGTGTGTHKHASLQPMQDGVHLATFNSNTSFDNIPYEAHFAEKDVIQDHVELEKIDVILQWLDAFRCFDKHRATLSQRQDGTCTWFLETDEYKEWVGGRISFLLLQGKAGAGKSVLVAHIIEQLEMTYTKEPCAFFYCDFGTERSTDPTEVLRSLLYQMLDQFYPGKVKISARHVVDELIKEKHKGKTPPTDISYLSSWIWRVADQFNQKPFIVVDALDECKDIDRLLLALLELHRKGLRLFVSSRPIQIVRHNLRSLPTVAIVDKMEGYVFADIELHVSRTMDFHPRLGGLLPALKKKVHSTLSRKADGMFRWVQCQLDTLKGCVTLQDFQEALDNLPTGLDATYERILLDIDQRPLEKKIARRALVWLATTSRPISITEMLEALSIDLQNWKLNQAISPANKSALLDALGSLVVYDEDTDIINLSHFSVKEYLMGALNRTKLPEYHINLREAHMQVFQSCLCYLAASLDIPEPFENEEHTKFTDAVSLLPFESKPLLDYVFSCGFDHLIHLDSANDDVLDSMATLQLKIRKHSSQWSHMCNFASSYRPYQSWITPNHDFIICVLISAFPESYLQAFLKRVPITAEFDSNPLVHAVRFEKVEHARTLLLYGVDVNRKGWDVDGLQGDSEFISRLPLEAALQREDSALFDLFLKEGGATIPQTLYWDIFHEPISDYPPRFVSILLQADEFVECAADYQDEGVLTPLNRNRYKVHHQVTETDLLAMVRRLVQIRHDLPPWPLGDVLVAVASAAAKGHLSLLEFLLSVDAPMPSRIWDMHPELMWKSPHQNLDIHTIGVSGDIVLRQVLGRCHCSFGESPAKPHCWELDCMLCSRRRAVLLASLGSKEERTLLTILTLSRKLRSTVNNARQSYPLQARRLGKIVSASGALLQAINTSFMDNSTLNCASWLCGPNPDACLKVLHRMLNLAGVEPPEEKIITEVDEVDWRGEQPSLLSEDKIIEIIALFDKEWGCLQSLLSASWHDVTDSVTPQGSADPLPISLSSRASYTSTCTQESYALASSIKIEYSSTLSNKVVLRQNPVMSTPRTLNPWLVPEPPLLPFPRAGSRWWWREIDVLFAGQTGVGKSSLINAVRSIPDHAAAAASVSRNGRPCTAHTSAYRIVVRAELCCRLWDTPGLTGVNTAARSNRYSMTRLTSRVSELASRHTEPLVLVWIVDASKTIPDIQLDWQQFHGICIKYSKTCVIPVVVFTKIRSDETGGVLWYINQVHQLSQMARWEAAYVPLLRVRKHRGTPSPEYIEDSKSFRNLLFTLALGIDQGKHAHWITKPWKNQAGDLARHLAGAGTVTTAGGLLASEELS